MFKIEAKEADAVSNGLGKSKSLKEIAKRVQSPSSILTYKQCPRKYYYQYIMSYPVKENIHLIRGKIVHSVLEKFYDMSADGVDTNNYIEKMTYYLKNLFNACWSKEKAKIIKLGLTEDQIVFYYEETILMLANWLNEIFRKIRNEFDKSVDFREAFKKIKPEQREEEFRSDNYMMRGFIDYIEQKDDFVKIMDYKTSKSKEITPEYKLQLAIYALLYEEKYGRKPNKVGLWVLKHGEVTLNVNEELVDLAKFEIEQIHFATQTTDIEDYPCKESPLCKFATGGCDFYNNCKTDKIRDTL